MQGLLENYHRLLEKVDNLCEGIATLLGDALTCHAGCSSCCQAISVFPVEAAAMIEAVGELSAEQQKFLKEHFAVIPDDGSCPLLFNDRCLLYQARPIICRTHGFPVLLIEGQTKRVDVCPLNCRDMVQMPGEAIIDLDRLNELLVSINLLYMREFSIKLPEKIPLTSLSDMLP